MRIGIDISQIVYEGTGVARYVREMVTALAKDTSYEIVLFGASLRKKDQFEAFFRTVKGPHVTLVTVSIPPTILDILWNILHIIPITVFTGKLDIFWSSDWTQPPLGGAKGITTIHDVSFLRYPESFDATIVNVQKRRLFWATRECVHFLCDSEATKKDVEKFFHISSTVLSVVYPGVTF